MQRTIAEARQHLTDLAPQLNPDVWAQMDGEIKEAEQAATAKAHTFISERFNEASAIGNETVTELCNVRDRANALVAAAKAGRLSAAEANDQLNALRSEYRRLEGDAGELARSAELIESIEGDPVGWADNAHARFPLIRPTFTF